MGTTIAGFYGDLCLAIRIPDGKEASNYYFPRKLLSTKLNCMLLKNNTGYKVADGLKYSSLVGLYIII